MATTDPTEGTLLAGKYRVERVLGRGGMGLVVAARHVQLDQRVAVKLMLPEALANAEAVSRFLREARAAARITSDHVVRVFDVGTAEGGQPFMAMEYLEGKDLGAVLAERGRLPPGEAAAYLLEACEAIAEAHASGVVHRDLKPSNLFLVRKRDGSSVVKVLDFGISKVTHSGAASDGAVTRTAALMGSPLYMSPEQMASSRDVDQRSDIWSLGVVLYEVLTGTLPFTADTLPQICIAVMNQEPASPASLVPGLPLGLSEVVQRCLAKSPAGRYQTIAELGQALAPYSAGAAGALERITHNFSHRATELAPVAAATAGGAATQGAWGKTRGPQNRRPVLLVTGVLLTATVGLALWFGTQESIRSDSAVAPATTAPTTPPPAPAAEKPAPVATAAAPSASSALVEPIAPLPSRATPIPRPHRPTPSKPVAPSTRVEAAPAPATPSAPAPNLGKPGARSRL